MTVSDLVSFEISDLVVLLTESAGPAEGVDMTDEIADIPFDELGYDSLALLQVVARVEREWGVRLPESVVESETCRELQLAVNVALHSLATVD